MSTETIYTIVASVITSFLTSLAFVTYKFGRYAEKIDQLEKCSLNGRLSKLEGQFETSQNAFFQRKSPISLTDKGLEALEESGAKQFVDSNIEELYQKIDKKNPSTAYDVQELSRAIASDLESDPRVSKMKDFVYERGIDFSTIASVTGIYLRDEVLKKKNWRQDDIDKYAPKIPS
ncbi:MAG: hypothetical protein IPK84_03215 [Candidatus Moraniibacteriota bacterium]|nr:MAG: hypothetical protein IPK84_03215 [Candidatus Moranbacteria bacterium]